MPLDKTQVCNLALSHIGESRQITDIDENTSEALALRLVYDHALEKILTEGAWRWARKRGALALTGTAPQEWEYSYAFPSDCVRALYVDDHRRVRRTDEEFQFQVESDGTQRLIYTDVEDAVLVYTRRAEDPLLYPAFFSEALSRLLAFLIAKPLGRDRQTQADCLQLYQTMFVKAVTLDVNQERTAPEPISSIEAARN